MDHDKNESSSERHVSFEEVVYHIEQGDIVDITLHPNQEKYPDQQYTSSACEAIFISFPSSKLRTRSS